MVRDKKQDKDIKKQILQSALELFAKFGFKKTAVDEIAKNARVAKGTIYNYFQDKDDLVKSAFREELELLFKRLQAKANENMNSVQKMANVFMEKIKVISESPVLLQVWSQKRNELEYGLENEREEFDRRELGLFEEIIKSGNELAVLPVADLRELGELFQNAFRGFEISYFEGCQNWIKERVEKFTEMTMEGFKKIFMQDKKK